MAAQLKKMQRSSRSKTQMSDLPSCLLREILSRVPLTTLSSSCRYVCSDWFKLTNTSLVLPLLEKLPTCLLQKDISETGDLLFGWVVEDKANTIDGNSRFHIQMAEFSTKLEIPISKLRCINSCNGLLCLEEIGCDPIDIYVCNPILGEWISIPCSLPDQYSPVDVVLGFSPASNQYKLLRTSFLSPMKGEGEIYTIGTGKWRSIGTTPQIHENFNTFLNGSLHWAEDTSQPICCFSFDDEVSRSIPMPETEFISVVELGVLNNCLCVSFHNDEEDDADSEVWVMKEYGVKESWTLLVVITTGIPGSLPAWKAEKILVDEYGGMCHHDLLFSLNAEDDEILVCDSGQFITYNARRKTSSIPQVVGPALPDGDENWVWAAFNPSLVSLQDIAKGEDVTVSSVRTKLKIF